MATAVARVDSVLPQLGQSKQLAHLLKKNGVEAISKVLSFREKKRHDLEPMCSNGNSECFDRKIGKLN